MQWNQIEGKWDTLKGKFKEKWGKLTDDDLMQIKGNRDTLVGKMKTSYGIGKEEAERQIEEFSRDLDKDTKENRTQ